ncbi:hypothetical protein [Paenibacillus herberti]|nr:hypothetical protein [Paenibacillus herberti]
MGPLKTFAGYLKAAKGVKAIEWASLPVIGPTLAGLAASKFGLWPIWLSSIGAVLLAFGVYYLYVRIYMGKMATIGVPEFHVEAFKAIRPKEYEMTWAQFVNKNDFTFEGLYDIVNAVFSQNNHDPSSVAYVVAYSQSQHDFLQSSIADLKNTIDEQELAIDELENELVRSENAVSYLVGIIKKVNENLYRYVNDRLGFGDMDFVTGFSLYRKEGNSLELILDKGTSGKHRTLNLDTDTHFAAVVAVKDEQEQAHYNNPYPGRHLVAFRMKMLKGETWVWCFHFDDDDERVLSLILENGIIESRQIRRLIHAFCLTLQKRSFSHKEVDQDAEAK